MLNLRERRQELGLQIADVAAIVGVAPATISRWETGGIKNLKRDKIYKLAKALQLNPLELVFDTVPEGKPVELNTITLPPEVAEFNDIYTAATDAERAQIMAIVRTFRK